MRRNLQALLLVLAAILASCHGGESAGPSVGDRPPPFGARTLAGDSVSLADFEGRVVLLNFWATWCTPCRQETPFLQGLYATRAAEGLVVMGVSVDTGDSGDQVGAFVRDLGVTYPVLVDPQMRGMDLYRVLGLPASFLVDRRGILRWMRFGPLSETDREFLNALESLLK